MNLFFYVIGLHNVPALYLNHQHWTFESVFLHTKLSILLNAFSLGNGLLHTELSMLLSFLPQSYLSFSFWHRTLECIEFESSVDHSPRRIFSYRDTQSTNLGVHSHFSYTLSYRLMLGKVRTLFVAKTCHETLHLLLLVSQYVTSVLMGGNQCNHRKKVPT